MNRIENYLRLFEHAPIATAILEADTLKVNLANDAMLKLWGLESWVVGMKLPDFMPEPEGQSYLLRIADVFKTGEYYHEEGYKMTVNRDGKQETIFVNYSYTPIAAEADERAALLILATEVSQQETGKTAMEEQNRKLNAIVMSSAVPMCIFKGEELKVEIVNQAMLDIWSERKRICTASMAFAFYEGGTRTVQRDHIYYSYTPLKDDLGKICGVVMIGNKLDN
jgi:PAS domain S-box-containing protein